MQMIFDRILVPIRNYEHRLANASLGFSFAACATLFTMPEHVLVALIALMAASICLLAATSIALDRRFWEDDDDAFRRAYLWFTVSACATAAVLGACFLHIRHLA